MSETLGPRLTRERRKSRAFFACAAGAVLLIAAAYATAIAEGAGETYTVKKGDTLWDIAAEKLGEATRWPEIWEGNRHIKDPHWIYPGDQIHFAGRGEPVGEVALAPAPEAAVAEPGPPKLYYSRAHAAGFVGLAEYEHAGKIISSYHDVQNLYEGLEVFIDRGAQDGLRPGDWFLVFRPGEPVLHPATKKPAGVRVMEVGHLKVVQVGEDSSRCRIMRSFNIIRRGDQITPFKPFPKTLTVRPAPEDVAGTVLAQQDGRLDAGRDDLVYLDVGLDNGVDVGSRLAVYREGARVKRSNAADHELPPDVIGEAVVVRAGQETSTALLTRASRSVRVGHRVAAISMLGYPTGIGGGISTDPAYQPKSADEEGALLVISGERAAAP